MDQSDLFIPPKDWQRRAEDWWDQVEFIMRYTRERIAEEILKEVCKGCSEGRTLDNERGQHNACKQARRDSEIASGSLKVHRFADGWKDLNES